MKGSENIHNITQNPLWVLSRYDSSYLANVATVELMSRTRQILSSANLYNGLGSINVSDVFVLYGCAAAIYFIINFSLSVLVRHMNAKKGRVYVGA